MTAFDDTSRPELRALEAFPFDHEGQSYIMLRDPSGFTDHVLSVPPVLFYVLTLIDGEHTLLEIERAFEERFGQPLERAELDNILNQLDEGMFLENERFRAARQAQLDAYLAAPVRPPAHVGAAYPGDEQQCRSFLDGFFQDAEGPRATERPASETGSAAGTLRGLITPHIDLQRGGVCSAHGFDVLATVPVPVDLVVVFGTSHQPMQRRFGVTKKAYGTPFGPIEADAELLERLEERFGDALYEDELNHRIEHSIEFQAVFLGYLFGENRPKMLPVLVGSLHEYVENGGDPDTDPEWCGFLDALRDEVAALGRRVVYVAGVDLAHVGRRFGAEAAPTPVDLTRLEAADRASLKPLETLDGGAFFRYIRDEKDERNVCGTASITAMMRILDADRGELLRYEQSFEDDTGSVVTYASMAFYG